MTIAAVVAAVAGCGSAAAYSSTRGARIVHFTLHSRMTHRNLHEILVEPPRHSRLLLVLLHGYHSSPSQFLSQPFFDSLRALGTRAPEVLLLDGGADSYWHDRADGHWGSMVLHEAIPVGIARTHARHVAIGGISMGGYGAALLGSPGAFDDAQDYARNNVFRLPSPHPLWIDLGAGDPFRTATLSYARRAGVRAHIRPGGHDAALWNAFTPKFLRFFASACA